VPLTKEEIQRKVLHFIFGTIIPVGIFYIPRYTPQLAWLPASIPQESRYWDRFGSTMRVTLRKAGY
jgi:hypothetical protein